MGIGVDVFGLMNVTGMFLGCSFFGPCGGVAQLVTPGGESNTIGIIVN